VSVSGGIPAAVGAAQDAAVTALQAAAAARALPPLTEISVEEARERVRSGNRLCDNGPELALVEDVELLLGHGAIAARRYCPEPERGDLPLLVYFHGGGWVTGDLDYSDELCRFLARDVPCEVVSVNYRLAPEHPFPAPLDDAWAALQRLSADRPARPLLVGGDSAGAGLAAGCAYRAGAEGIALAGQLLLYPAVDHDFTRPSYQAHRDGFPIGRASMRWFWDHYARPEDRDRASPLRADDPSGFPSTAVVVAGHDPLHDEGVAFARRLSSAGVRVDLMEYPQLVHGFLRFTAAVPAAREAVDDIVRLLRQLVHIQGSDA
jgi:acetyl esterase